MMKKKKVLKMFHELNIKSSNDLYDFIVKNGSSTIDGRTFDLNNNKETVDFMALFLEAMDFEFIKFRFEKADYIYWFLVFYDGKKWFYFEPNLKDIGGQFSFINYNELIFFVTQKLNGYFGYKNENYVIKEFMNGDDEGTEIFVNDKMTFDKNDDVKPTVQSSFMRDMRDFKDFGLFIFGFVVTLGICLLVLIIITAFEWNI